MCSSDWQLVYREERRRPGYVIENGRTSIMLSEKRRTSPDKKKTADRVRRRRRIHRCLMPQRDRARSQAVPNSSSVEDAKSTNYKAMSTKGDRRRSEVMEGDGSGLGKSSYPGTITFAPHAEEWRRMSITSCLNQKAERTILITSCPCATSAIAGKQPLKAGNDGKQKTQSLKADGRCRGVGKNKNGKLT